MDSANVDEIRLFEDTATRFAREVVAPEGAALDRAEADAVLGVLGRARDLGLTTLCAPSDVGGLDQDVESLCVVLRCVARENAGVATALFVHASAQHALRASGAWPRDVDASDLLAWPAFAASGALAGVRLDGAEPRASGTTPLVPLAMVAQHVLLPARSATTGTTWIHAPIGARGLARARVDVLGLRCCAPADLVLDDVEEFRSIARAQERDEDAWRATAVTSIALGVLEGSLASALEYARGRPQGGRLIVEWPEVRRMLAEMREASLLLEAALAGVLAARRASDPRAPSRAMAVALRATEHACRGTVDGVQLLGGNGYTKHFPQERRMRDARQLRCLAGSSPSRSRGAFDEWLASTGALDHAMPLARPSR